MDKEIKDIMKKLGAAINETIQDSEAIQKLLQEIEAKGYTLTLSLGVILGIDQTDRPRRRPRRIPEGAPEAPAGPTPFDRKFLKALRIKIIEERS